MEAASGMGRSPETLGGTPDPADNPAQTALKTEDKGLIQQILMKIPVQHRDVLVLRYYQEMSVEEMAEVLGCSVSAAKVRLHRARHHFKEMYVATYGPQQDGAAEPLP